jgi:hypothetical protein
VLFGKMWNFFSMPYLYNSECELGKRMDISIDICGMRMDAGLLDDVQSQRKGRTDRTARTFICDGSTQDHPFIINYHNLFTGQQHSAG